MNFNDNMRHCNIRRHGYPLPIVMLMVILRKKITIKERYE